MKTEMASRWGTKALSLLLSLLLCLWMLPSAWADEANAEADQGVTDVIVDADSVTEVTEDGSEDGGEIDVPSDDVVEKTEDVDGDVDADEDADTEKDPDLPDEVKEPEADPVEDEADESIAAESVSDESAAVSESVLLASRADVDAARKKTTPVLKYAVHAKSLGWMNEVGSGSVAGTTGRALGVEALRLSLSAGTEGGIAYQAYASGKGWLAQVANGAIAGTTGQSRSIQAIKINLTGAVASEFDVYYRVHSAGVGWLGWTSNGEAAGTSGFSYAIEAVQVAMVKKGGSAPGLVGSAYRSAGDIAYRAHVASIGWRSPVADGVTAGTTGRSLAVEALQIETPDSGHQGSIVYAAHVAGIGWQPEVGNGATAGTTGRGLQVEALKVRLTGELAGKYDVYYRVHVQGYGWLGWASNGAEAGTTGLSFRMEAVEIKLVQKGGSAPGSTARPKISKASVSSMAHVQGDGWQSWRGSGSVVGTTGRSLSVEALQMKLASDISGGISYRLHVQGIGWQNWVSDGRMAGTTGRALRAEAVSIKLTGEAARYYDVYYRVHAQGYGWLGWASNGSNAGTSSCSYRMEALQVVVVGKGGAAPGSTAGAYQTKPLIPASQAAMNNRANGLSSSTGWLLLVDTSNCLVGVYRGSRGNWSNYAFWPCAPGLSSSPTVKGLFSVAMRGYSFGSGYTCYYWTQFYGDYLFHSIKYYPGTHTVMDGTLGRPASAGCVRLAIENAKWIHDNIPSHTTVLVY